MNSTQIAEGGLAIACLCGITWWSVKREGDYAKERERYLGILEKIINKLLEK